MLNRIKNMIEGITAPTASTTPITTTSTAPIAVPIAAPLTISELEHGVAVRVELEKVNRDDYDITWGIPKSLDSELLPVLPFNAELLPIEFREYTINSAHRINRAAPDFVAISIMTSLGAIIGTSCSIRPKLLDTSWTVRPNLWGFVVADPSGKKTPTIKAGLRLLEYAQAEYIDKKNTKNAEVGALLAEQNDAKLEKLRSDAKRAFNDDDHATADAIYEEIALIEKINVAPRNIIINDATVEALTLRMSNNPQGVLLFRDELTGWLRTIDCESRANEKSIYLEAFDASKTPFIIDRISRDNLVIPSLALSILGGVQPDRLLPIIQGRDSGGGNDGFLERFQMSVYPDRVMSEYIDIAPNVEAERQAKAIFLKLAELGDQSDIEFYFNKTAQTISDDWAVNLNQKINNAPRDFEAVYGKYHALMAKLALLLHLVEEASHNTVPFTPNLAVSEQHVQRAILWMDYLESHAKRILAMGKKDTENTSAKILLEKLPKLGRSFTKHQLTQQSWKGLKNKIDRERAIQVLEDSGYIKSMKNPARIVVNPRFLSQVN